MCTLVLEDVGSVRGRNSKEEWAHGSKSTGLAFHTLLMPGETSMPLMGINWNLQCRCLADDSACRTHNMSVQRTRPCLHNGQNRMLLINFSPPGTLYASKGKNCTREPGSIILFLGVPIGILGMPQPHRILQQGVFTGRSVPHRCQSRAWGVAKGLLRRILSLYRRRTIQRTTLFLRLHFLIQEAVPLRTVLPFVAVAGVASVRTVS